MNTTECEKLGLIGQGEGLKLEFKSDLKCLLDRELVAAVVSLANTEGGDLFLGLEDEGTITGLHLIGVGLIEAHGSGRGRSCTLSAGAYKQAGQKATCIRRAGLDAIQQEQMVLSYIDRHGSIKREEAMDLCRLGKDQHTDYSRGS